MSTEAFKAARDILLAYRNDHAAACRDFQWPRLDRFNWALDWFDAVLARGEPGSRPALRIVGDGAAVLTFAELSERSNRVANGLRSLGVRRGDRILLMLGNVVPLWELMLASMKLGAVMIPATTLLTTNDLRDRFMRGRVRHVVTAAADTVKFEGLDPTVTRIAVGDAPLGNAPLGNAPLGNVPLGNVPLGWIRYEELLQAAASFTPEAETPAADPMLLYFTSGTTAKPKLVSHSHQSYPVGHLTTMYVLGLQPGDLHLNISSPGWAKHAYSCFFAPWNAGATVFIANQTRFNAPAMLDAIADNKVTTLCAPPTVWRMFVQEDLKSRRTALREICSAGEPLNPEVIDQVREAWNLTIRDFYGQTETTSQVGNAPGVAVKPGSMGLPMPGYRIRVLDTEDNDANEGEVCIALDPPPTGLMLGYQDDEGGFLPLGTDVYRTGDVASRDADGYLTFIGRADDVFKASDYRVSPFELESALIEHDAVAEAAVVPAPDPTRTAVPKAYVTLASGAAPDRDTALSIFRHMRTAVAPYKRVRRLEFADLPKTISGKIRRVELRQAEDALAKSATRPQGEFREEDFPELQAR